MPRETIKQILMRRDDLTHEQADQAIQAAKDDLEYLIAGGYFNDAERICEDHFGLEPDYLDELL